MSVHAAYLMLTAALVFTAWLVPVPERNAASNAVVLDPGYYCIGSQDGDRVYAPGRQRDGNVIVIWSSSGRLHYIPPDQLHECAE